MEFKLKNLHPDPEFPSELIPALPPSVVPLEPGWKPFSRVAVAGIDRLLMYDGSAIGILVGNNIVSPTRLDGELHTAVCIGIGSLILTTSAGREIIEIDPDTFAMTKIPNYGRMLPRLRAEAAEYVYATPASVKIDVAAAVQGVVATAAQAALARSACDAYRALDDAARRRGVCWQPVVARVRGCDSDGITLFLSESVVLAHPSKGRFEGRFTFDTLSVEGYVSSAEVSAPAWRPVLEVPDELIEALPEGASIEVEMTAPLYGCDTSRLPEVSARRRSSDSLVVVNLQSADTDLKTFVSNGYFNVFTTRTPSRRMEIEVSLPCGLKKADISQFETQLLKTATSGAVSSSTVAWGNPTVSRPDPLSPTDYAITTDTSSPWHGYSAVEFADGSVQVAVAQGESDAPDGFSPVLSYPAPDAVALTIAVSARGEVRRGRFPLVPAGNRAIYVHPALQPVKLTETLGSYVPPASRPADRVLTGKVAVASVSAPTVPFTVASTGAGRVTAVMPAVAGQSSWDFGRSRFYVFTTGGISVLNSDPARRSASVSLIDCRVVASQDAVCRVDGALACIASGDILLLSGSKIKRIARVEKATALAWNHTDHELWCFTPDGAVVICFNHGYMQYSVPIRIEGSPVQLSLDATYLPSSPLRRLGATAYAASVEIACETRMKVPRRCGNPRLFIDCPGEYESLTVNVFRTDGRNRPEHPDFQIEASGRISAPLTLPLLLPPTARDVDIVINATAAPSSRLRQILIQSSELSPLNF